MKASLALAFLCLLALSYMVWAQQQELVMLAEAVGNLQSAAIKPAPKPRAPRTPKPKEAK